MTIREITLCNNLNFFISSNSFQQHKLIRFQIRKYINFLILNLYNKLIEKNAFRQHLSSIVCIGGESYLYGISNNFNYIINYTNSLSIYNDVILNNSIYKTNLDNYYIDYNKFVNIKNSDLLIINLAKLHINLLKQINTRYYKYIIIINCHHNDFWKKIKLLTNFKIISRKQFIVTNYFVTVSLFQYKSSIPLFISLGNTCAIAYQLKLTGLRTLAFPFDWCKISINQINQVLNNNFHKFNELKVVKYSTNHKLLPLSINNHTIINNDGSYILKNSYNILFAHELYKINNYHIDNLKNIIDNRIKNFINAKNENIYFIIHKSNLDLVSLHQLINNLKKYFTNFKIIYITNKQSINSDLKSQLTNYQSIKLITIDYNIINWEDWKLTDINWFDLFFNKI